MSTPSTVLKILFSIPQSQIDRDVADGEQDFARLMDQTRASRKESRDSDDPEATARSHHKQMVRAKVIRHHETIPEEMKYQFIHMAADHIAEEAMSVAHERGNIAELGRQMREIEQREGLEEGEYWPIGEGPDDYNKLSEECDDLYDKVHDTVMVTVLRRYGLGDIADVFEQDRARFDAIVERGRKMIFDGGKN